MDAGSAPYAVLLEQAQLTMLHDLVDDDDFVAQIFSKDFADDSQEDTRLATVLVDKFHDAFVLSSKQRRFVTRSIMQSELNMKQIYDVFNTPAPAPAPAAGIASVETLTGPYPIQGARTPEVLSGKSTPAKRATSMPPLSRGDQAQEQGSPGRRNFGDIVGILQDQPLVQVIVGHEVEEAPSPPVTADLANDAPMYTEAAAPEQAEFLHGSVERNTALTLPPASTPAAPGIAEPQKDERKVMQTSDPTLIKMISLPSSVTSKQE